MDLGEKEKIFVDQIRTYTTENIEYIDDHRSPAG